MKKIFACLLFSGVTSYGAGLVGVPLSSVSNGGTNGTFNGGTVANATTFLNPVTINANLSASNILSATFQLSLSSLTNGAVDPIRVWEQMPTPAVVYDPFDADATYDEGGSGANGGLLFHLRASNILAVANSIATNGQLAAIKAAGGDFYINYTDGWQNTNRVNGHLVANPILLDAATPTVAVLVDKVHNLGIKMMKYFTSTPEGVPTTSCLNLGFPTATMPSQVQLDFADADLEGFDGKFVDACGFSYIVDPTNQLPYIRMFSQANQHGQRPGFLFMTVMAGAPSVNGGIGGLGGSDVPIQPEVPYLLNTWPASGSLTNGAFGGNRDSITNTWWAANFIYSNAVTTNFSQMIGKGHCTTLGDVFFGTYDESALQAWFVMSALTVSHFRSLGLVRHSLSSASLVSVVDPSQWTYWTNKTYWKGELDPAMRMGYPVYSNALAIVWVRPLGNDGVTNLVGMINLDRTNALNIPLTNSWLSGTFGTNCNYTVVDVFAQTIYTNFLTAWTNAVPSNSIAFYQVYPRYPQALANVTSGGDLNFASAINVTNNITQYGSSSVFSAAKVVSSVNGIDTQGAAASVSYYSRANLVSDTTRFTVWNDGSDTAQILTFGQKDSGHNFTPVLTLNLSAGAVFGEATLTPSSIIKSNSIISGLIPTLGKGDIALWASNGVLFAICVNGAGTITTNKIVP